MRNLRICWYSNIRLKKKQKKTKQILYTGNTNTQLLIPGGHERRDGKNTLHTYVNRMRKLSCLIQDKIRKKLNNTNVIQFNEQCKLKN